MNTPPADVVSAQSSSVDISNKESMDQSPNGHHKPMSDSAPGTIYDSPVGEDSDESTEDGEDDDDEGEDADYEEEEGDEEEDEPALKYERMGGFIPDLTKKDSISSMCATTQSLLAIGTHGGWVHLVDEQGKRVSSYRLHHASILDISVDINAEFITTASMDGLVVVRSITASETYTFDYKRPMRTVSMEPNFAKRSSKAIVCGGLAGNLSIQEKGWLGHKERILHSGEGPIWQVRWKDRFIAWANDYGVKIYDTTSHSRITFIDRPADSPRADLFKCNLHWQDSSTLLIAWADYIKVARIRNRPKSTSEVASSLPPFLVEITAVFQLESMIAGIVPHALAPPSQPGTPILKPVGASSRPASIISPALPLTSLLVLAYAPPDTFDETSKDTKRKRAERPELQIISRSGEEMAADALGVANYERWSCNDYHLLALDLPLTDAATNATVPLADFPSRNYVVASPLDVIIVKPRDRRDHVTWLVDHGKYEDAINEVEVYGTELTGQPGDEEFDLGKIGALYITSLIDDGLFAKAASLAPKIGGKNPRLWRTWVYAFAERGQLHEIIPYVPISSPQLDRTEYEIILGDLLQHDRKTFLKTIQEWPSTIYDVPTVINYVRSALDAGTPLSVRAKQIAKADVPEPTTEDNKLLMECLALLYLSNRQPGKALPYYLRLKRPSVFDLIRDNNLFTAVQDQACLLVQFDAELRDQGLKQKDEAIQLLVDHIHSIPIGRVVHQLQGEPDHLFRYLDALWKKDPALVTGFADLQIKLFAEYAPKRLIDFLRSSSSYNLESAYDECKRKDLVDEMVFLLGEMGGYKKALTLIIERLGDVNRAIDFAKERKDNDLWEDLLKYSETRPTFIRGLLENVGPEIDPIRLIRRIKDGLEVPGLKDALIKILHDFQLQISLLDGCQTILNGDSSSFSRRLQKDQTSGFFLTAKTLCPICHKSLQEAPQRLVLLFFCRHVVHAHCLPDGEDFPVQPDSILRGVGMAGYSLHDSARRIGQKIAFESNLRGRIPNGCPVCRKRSEGLRSG